MGSWTELAQLVGLAALSKKTKEITISFGYALTV
jgi:hypothetical protein